MSLLDALVLEGWSDPREIWIALRTDGQRGSGTPDDPYDGGTALGPGFSATLNQDTTATDNRTVSVTQVTGHALIDGDVVRIPVSPADAQAYAGQFPVFNVTASSFQYRVAIPFVSTPPADVGVTAAKVLYRFDEVMRTLGAWLTLEEQLGAQGGGARIHIGPGVFETRGFVPRLDSQAAVQGWALRARQHITGAGIGATTLKLMHATSPDHLTLAIGHDPYSPPYVNDADHVVVADLTVDCNLRSQLYDRVVKGAVSAKGSHIRLVRIRAIDFGTQAVPECFVLGTAGGDPSRNERVNCRIEDCIVEQPGLNSVYNNGCLILFAGEQESTGQMGFHRACAIRNNYVNHEYLDGPVAIAGISVAAGVATVTTRVPHGRAQNQWVVISGALINGSLTNSFNGSYKITEIPTSVSFKVTLVDWTGTGIPTSSPGGDMWVDRFTSHLIPVLKLEKINATTARMTTLRPHNRKPGQMVNVIPWSGRPPAGAEPYFGRLPIAGESDFSPTVLTYQTNGDPTVTLVEAPFVVYLGMTAWGLSAGGGSEAVTEGNRIFGCRFGGTYTDTWRTKDFTDRNNFYSDVTTGPYQNITLNSALKLGSSVVRNGSNATFQTQLDHNLGQNQTPTLLIRGALVNGTYANRYNGKITVTTDATDPTRFTYGLGANLPADYPNSGGSPVFELASSPGSKIKTGSALIRKEGAATTGVLTTILPHGLATNQMVTIQGARIGETYPSSFNGDKQITVPGGSTTTFEIPLGSGSSTDPDASGSPVFSTEQPAQALTNPGGGNIARYEVANPTGLFVGQIVKVSGASTAAYNGQFRVSAIGINTQVTPNRPWFEYVMDSAPAGAAGGSPQFTAFLSVSSIARSDEMGGTSSPLLYFKVTTADKHRLVVGDTVSIWGASVSSSLVNPYNGAFRVEKSLGDTAFLCALDYDPGADPTGTISWASQNSTPLTRMLLSGIPFGEFTTDQPVPAGQTLFAEDQRISLFGAATNGSFNGYFNTVVRVAPNPTRRSFRFRIREGDPGTNASGSPACASAVGTPLKIDGTAATYHTVLKHGLVPGEAIFVHDPNLDLGVQTLFRGYFSIESIPSETSLTWTYPSAPGSNGPSPYHFGALWQTRQSTIESNVIELEEVGTGDPWGIAFAGAIYSAGLNFAAHYLYRRTIVRENLIRLTSNSPPSQARAILSFSAENSLVHDNIVGLSATPPIPGPIHGTGNKFVSYFNNQTPTGLLIQGVDTDANAKYDEVAILIEDALLLSI